MTVIGYREASPIPPEKTLFKWGKIRITSETLHFWGGDAPLKDITNLWLAKVTGVSWSMVSIGISTVAMVVWLGRRSPPRLVALGVLLVVAVALLIHRYLMHTYTVQVRYMRPPIGMSALPPGRKPEAQGILLTTHSRRMAHRVFEALFHALGPSTPEHYSFVARSENDPDNIAVKRFPK